MHCILFQKISKHSVLVEHVSAIVQLSILFNPVIIVAAAAKSLQSCLTLWDPIDGSPPGSPVPGILQARTLEWVAISFSNAWKWKVKVKSLSRVQLLATPWTAAYQASPSMGFARQEYWSGSPLPSPQLSLLIGKIAFQSLLLFIQQIKHSWKKIWNSWLKSVWVVCFVFVNYCIKLWWEIFGNF